MRILTITCCTLIFLPIFGLSVSANPIGKDNNDSFSWTTDSSFLTNVVAQNNPKLSNTETTEIGSSWSESDSVDREKVRDVLQELNEVGNLNFRPRRGSPGITIANPYGFGGQSGKFFVGTSFTSDTRAVNSLDSDGGMVFGATFGDSRKAVGLELSYSLVSFGDNRDFGTGGFNAKLYRMLGNDASFALGYNGFLNFGDDNDLEDSIYGVVTKIFRTRENIDSAFSRVAVSAGLGNGQYRTWEAVLDDDDQVNVFSSLALRIAEPVSFITEYTGQDLALGFSISPFKNLPLTITPALRDVAGGDESINFALGVGLGFPF